MSSATYSVFLPFPSCSMNSAYPTNIGGRRFTEPHTVEMKETMEAEIRKQLERQGGLPEHWSTFEITYIFLYEEKDIWYKNSRLKKFDLTNVFKFPEDALFDVIKSMCNLDEQGLTQDEATFTVHGLKRAVKGDLPRPYRRPHSFDPERVLTRGKNKGKKRGGFKTRGCIVILIQQGRGVFYGVRGVEDTLYPYIEKALRIYDETQSPFPWETENRVDGRVPKNTDRAE